MRRTSATLGLVFGAFVIALLMLAGLNIVHFVRSSGESPGINLAFGVSFALAGVALGWAAWRALRRI